MTDEFWVRATLVKHQIDRVMSEAHSTTDIERLDALHAEMTLLTDNMEAIREEQLISMLPKPKAEKKRWWRLGR